MTSTLLLIVPIHLSPFAMCPAFPDSDYYGDSVAIGLAPLGRSCVFLSSYVLAWFRPSTHPYSRDHLSVSHRTGLVPATPKPVACDDIALSQHKRWGSTYPNQDWTSSSIALTMPRGSRGTFGLLTSPAPPFSGMFWSSVSFDRE
jgi:hypothetical protein